MCNAWGITASVLLICVCAGVVFWRIARAREEMTRTIAQAVERTIDKLLIHGTKD